MISFKTLIQYNILGYNIFHEPQSESETIRRQIKVFQIFLILNSQKRIKILNFLILNS